MKPTPKPWLQNLQAYVPGKSSGSSTKIKLSSNENPLGPSPKAIDAIAKESVNLHRYPDDSAISLKKEIAKINQISSDNIILGVGSDEVIAMAIHAFASQGDTVLTSAATFPMYGIFAKSAGSKVHQVPLTAGGDIDLAKIQQIAATTKTIVCLADPNNPTGKLLDIPLFESAMTANRNVVFLYDCAYEEYRVRPINFSWQHLLNTHPNLIVSRTFSKAYGLAGARIGYLFGSAEIINTIAKLRPPFNVSSLAISAAESALKDQSHLKEVLTLNRKMLLLMQDFCDRHKLQYFNSSANFLFLQLPPCYSNPGNLATTGLQWAKLLEQSGYIVRALAGIGYDDWIRVSTGTENQTEGFLAVLEKELQRTRNHDS